MTTFNYQSSYLHYEQDSSQKHNHILWIICSHVNIPEGKFAQSNIFKDISGNKLFLNCPNNSWYQQGLDDNINSLDKLLDILIAFSTKFTYVRIVGHSMGAYLAQVLNIVLNNVEYSIITSPETELMIPASRSQINKVNVQEGWGNVIKLSETRPLPPSITLFGAFDFIDAYYISRLEKHSTAYRNVLIAPFHHGITEYLNMLGYYKKLLNNPFEQIQELINERILYYPYELGTDLAFVDFYNLGCIMKKSNLSKDDHIVVKQIEERRSRWNNDGIKLLFANYYRKMNNITHSIEILQKVCSNDSYFLDCYVFLAKLLNKHSDEINPKEIEKFKNNLPNISLIKKDPRVLDKIMRRLEPKEAEDV